MEGLRCPMRHRIVPLNPDRPLQAYVVGLAIGDRSLSIACLRGLIETDGCIYTDRGHPSLSHPAASG